MNLAEPRRMIPLLASGAASLANVLVNRVSGASASTAGETVTLDAKAFERALSKATGDRSNLSPAQQQAAALNHRLMQSPEIEAAVSARPQGSVSAVEVRQDGSVFVQTSEGPVAVQLSLESRELAKQAYATSVVTGVAGVDASSGTQSVLRIPVSRVGLS
jgi:hypothetical protein